jgi:hypothetical protein
MKGGGASLNFARLGKLARDKSIRYFSAMSTVQEIETAIT